MTKCLQSGYGGCGAIGEFRGVDGDPAGIGALIESGQQLGPVCRALADRGGSGAAVCAEDGVAREDVANERSEPGEDLIEVPVIAEEGDGVEIEGKPGAVSGHNGAVDRGETGEFAAEGDRDAIAVGAFSEVDEGVVHL